MTTDELISRAIHAINTNQPRLAQTYMRQALVQTDDLRHELNPLKWELRRVGAGFNAIAVAIAGLFEPFQSAVRRMNEMEETRARMKFELGMKNDYVLGGPAK